MSGDLVSKRARNAFREYLVGWILRDIEMEFEAAGIDCDREYEPHMSGDRRSFVEQHYHTLDFENVDDIRKLLTFFKGVLRQAEKNLPDSHDRNAAQLAIDELVECLRVDGFRYYSGKISPTTPAARDILQTDNSISELTRRNIIDYLLVENVVWSGRLNEAEFLSRLYDLESIPSSDHRFSSISGDIWQHRENNDDWPNDWVFNDIRFDLLGGSDEEFLRFLCEMVHPVVRPDEYEVIRIVETFNKHLAPDGWRISAGTYISGKPAFSARRLLADTEITLGNMKSIAYKLDAAYVSQQITRMEASIETDPELAIGTAKEFLETVCKTILNECGEDPGNKEDLPQLVKQVREHIGLLPDDIPANAKGADSIKRLLSNLGTVAQGIAEIRGLYGTGHGKHAKVKGLQPRHARLVVGAAGTLGVFLFETYQERQKGEAT